MHTSKFRAGLFSLSFLFSIVTTASGNYFLCGGDEDGCDLSTPSSCLCMPVDDITKQQPYCLNFNALRCQPLADVKNCEGGFVAKNQSDCLATLFQSEPTPACPTVSHDFCTSHHVALCAKDGGVDTCRTTMMVRRVTLHRVY